MAKYTIELFNLVNIACMQQGIENRRENWPLIYPYIGLDRYPVFEKSYRDHINALFIDTYSNFEIGYETPELWRSKVAVTFDRIMPYYNKLYESNVLTVERLTGKSFTERRNTVEKMLSQATGSSSGTSESGAETSGQSIDTPQSHADATDLGYLTAAQNASTSEHGKNDVSSTSDGKRDTDRGETVEHEAQDPDYLHTLLTWGRQLLSLDDMLMNDDRVARLFMQIW